ncbi:MAG: hypothetical protein ACOC1K_04070, partial [Nanoarchaeota archaeon]
LYKNIDNWEEKIYMFKQGIKERPICKFNDCNNETFFILSAKHYSNNCQIHKGTKKENNIYYSNKENEVFNFVKSIYEGKIEKNIKFNGIELDMYLPDINKGIEFNGLYWHSEIYRDKNYHYNKWKKSKDIGIKLISIWEDDWDNKKEIIKSIISNELYKSKKIYARKCCLRNVSYNEKKHFLKENHLQGDVVSSVNLGLYYGNELVSLMTFGKKRMILKSNSSINDYELLRFCNKLNFTVIGGASKLFKYFKNNFSYNNIISYCNLDISNGNLYEKLDFKFNSYTGPGYWWFKDGVKYHRSNFMKHLLEKKYGKINTTADEFIRSKGFYKIWNIGNYKYIY